jgi:glycosyltransferase involved in cell wall biosynthesis
MSNIDFSRCLFSSSDSGGCGLLRSYLPAKNLGGHYSRGINPFENDLSIYNYIFLQRNHQLHDLGIVDDFHTNGQKVYYDIDDDVWNIDEKNPAKQAFTKEVLNIIERVIAKCDGVYVSTEPLRERLLNFHSKVNIVPNLVEYPIGTEKMPKSKVRIGYAGSISHVGDFSKELISAIKKIKHKHDSKVEFVFIGYVPEELRNVVTFYDGALPSWYLEAMNNINFDIGLAPLANTMFNRSKSNLKFLDYTVCGACTVASNVYPYQEIEQWTTGVLVDRFMSWYDVLMDLVDDVELRNRITQNANEFVNREYTWSSASYKHRNVYNTTLEV